VLPELWVGEVVWFCSRRGLDPRLDWTGFRNASSHASCYGTGVRSAQSCGRTCSGQIGKEFELAIWSFKHSCGSSDESRTVALIRSFYPIEEVANVLYRLSSLQKLPSWPREHNSFSRCDSRADSSCFDALVPMHVAYGAIAMRARHRGLDRGLHPHLQRRPLRNASVR
jgi:hypothetical protein